MLIPAVSLYFLILAALITVAGWRRRVAPLVAVAVLLWLSSLLSALFVGWAWIERDYSENWAMYGVLFVSLAVIVSNGVLVIAALTVAFVRRIEGRERVRRSLYLLSLFLASQIVMGIWAA